MGQVMCGDTALISLCGGKYSLKSVPIFLVCWKLYEERNIFSLTHKVWFNADETEADAILNSTNSTTFIVDF